jgi:branched-chain amino acid aminotransferase
MTDPKYICFNGEFRRAAESFLLTRNRAFLYGDALFENIHVFATEAQFLEYHFNRMINGTKLLFMEIPPWLTMGYLAQLITQMLNRNRIFGGGCIRLTLYRDGGRMLTPEGNQTSFVMESLPLSHDYYVLNEKGLVADVCMDYHIPSGPLAGIKTTASLLYILAAIYCARNHLDDAVLLNDAGHVAASVRSNIFLVKDSSLFTPGLKEGCIPGVMREVILKFSSDAGIRINDQISLTPAALEDADEIFFTNAIEGIRWVGALRHRRYFKKTALLLTRILNEQAFSREAKNR